MDTEKKPESKEQSPRPPSSTDSQRSIKNETDPKGRTNKNSWNALALTNKVSSILSPERRKTIVAKAAQIATHG